MGLPDAAEVHADGHRGTRQLLRGHVAGDPAETLRLNGLLAGLGRRAFGMLLFIAALPAFIPIPVGGAVAGPLVVLIGLQLLAGRRRPWLPLFLGERGPRREALARFERRIDPWLARIERVLHERLAWVFDARVAAMFTGLLLVLLGLLLSLPIPFTNFLFGFILLAFALALIERDGALMLLCWAGGAIAVAAIGVLSGNLASAAARWLDFLF